MSLEGYPYDSAVIRSCGIPSSSGWRGSLPGNGALELFRPFRLLPLMDRDGRSAGIDKRGPGVGMCSGATRW